jgi:hypothetical protein
LLAVQAVNAAIKKIRGKLRAVRNMSRGEERVRHSLPDKSFAP